MSEDSPASRFQRPPAWWVAQGVLAVVALFFLFHAFQPLLYTLRVIADFPFQLDREEGFLLHQAMRLSEGKTIYPEISSAPYTVGNYTPLYPFLYSIVLWFAEPGLAAGRALVFLSTLGVCGGAGWFLWRETRQLLPAILAPALFLCTWDLNNWVAFARVDLPALFFGFAGFVVATRAEKRWQWIAAAALFVAAFFTKQTQVFAPAAVVLWLLFEKRWRDAGLLAGMVAGACLVIGLLLIAVTGGEFWKHTVTYNQNEFVWWQLGRWLEHLWFFNRWLLAGVVVAAGVAAWKLWKEKEGPQTRVLLPAGIYLVLAALSIASIAKEGSAANYLLEFDLLAAVFVCLVLGAELNRPEQTFSPRWIVPGALVVLLAGHAVLTGMHRPILFQPAPGRQSQNAGNYLLLKTDSAEGEVFSEDPVFPILAGKEVHLQPFIMTRLAQEGKWEQEPFVEDLQSRRFSLLILTQNVEEEELVVGLTPAMKEAIVANYDLEERVPLYGNRVFFLYRPSDEE